MLQLILHGLGDYYFQTDKQALGKKLKGWYGFKCCLIHCITYSLPFLFIASWQAVMVIFLTHFIIDRTNLIAYIIAYKNNVKKKEFHESTLGNLGWLFPYMYDISNFGFGKEIPFAITIWLYIICDNIAHIICNYLAIKYL